MADKVRARVNGNVPKATLTFWAPVIEMARNPRWGRTGKHTVAIGKSSTKAIVVLRWISD